VLQANARDEVLQRAGLMMDAARAMRGYTIDEIKPLLVPHMTEVFFPQTVPAYAATQAFDKLRESQPEYIYKEATLNPTNPRDRATDWETHLIQQFRNHSSQTQIVGTRQTATGPSLYMARSIQISNPGCLACHSTPDAAPVSMIDLYGAANGFGWQLDEVIGAQVVSVPMTVANDKARKTLLTVMGLLTGGFLLTAIVLNVMLRHIVITPAIRMSAIADEVSKGNLDAPEISSSGRDEIATLGESFSRMRRSLEKAMKMLED
jgi:HAMP domain-containing protein